MIISFIIVVLACLYFKPYIDRTRNGSIVIWFNWKGDRTYKFLYKK